MADAMPGQSNPLTPETGNNLLEVLFNYLGLVKINFENVPYALEGTVILGCDIDGKIKLKDQNGNVIEVGGGGGYTPSYKVYTALLTQAGTDAPVATILENTLESEITFHYEAAGYYYAECELFNNPNNLWYNIQQNYGVNNPVPTFSMWHSFTINRLYIESGNAGTSINELLGAGGGTPIEIRIYN